MQLPYFDLKCQYAALRTEILSALDRVCQNSLFILGDEVTAFEKEFAAFCNVKHCVALNTGTSALHLALLAVGVRPGDEVITPANTFVATAEAIAYTGCKPVFVDIDSATANIDPTAIEAAITPRTRVILPVHLYGRPANMKAILNIAQHRKLFVIEDACQAHGACCDGKMVGSMGTAAAFSFYPGKNLGAYGEGGALTTNDDHVAALARALRDHGQNERYHHDYIGFNYRMDGFQGAVLRIKLKHLPSWNRRRREIAGIYRRILAGARVELPCDNVGSDSVYHLFTAFVDNRDRVRTALKKRGVDTAVHYPVPVHLQAPFRSLGYHRGRLPKTERACECVFSMPIFPEMTDEQVTYAGEELADVVGRQ